MKIEAMAFPPATANVQKTGPEITRDTRLVATQRYGQKQKLVCASTPCLISVISDVKTGLKPTNCVAGSM